MYLFNLKGKSLSSIEEIGYRRGYLCGNIRAAQAAIFPATIQSDEI